MKKIISFDKNLDFKTMIGEISSISLDHTLTFEDESNITGEFFISGKYKLTEATRLEENFEFRLPVEIVLGEKLEDASRKIEIDDFRYEIENDDSLACHIEVKVEGVEMIDDEEELSAEPQEIIATVPFEEEELVRVADCVEEVEVVEEVAVDEGLKIEDIEIKEEVDEERECDGDAKTIEESQDIEPIEEEVITTKEAVDEANVGSLFSSFKDSDETFSTYSVYIVRQAETIEAIMDKYQVTKEQLESYNNLSNIEVGSKIIIPTSHE